MEEPSASDKSVKLNKTSPSGNLLMDKSFTARDGVIRIGARIKTGESAGFKMTPYVFDSAGNMAETIAFDGGNIKVNIGGTYQNVQTFTPGTWYDIDLVIDMNTDKFDFYVNHMKKRTQVALRTAVSDIAKIRFGMGSSVSGTLYIDDVKVYN